MERLRRAWWAVLLVAVGALLVVLGLLFYSTAHQSSHSEAVDLPHLGGAETASHLTARRDLLKRILAAKRSYGVGEEGIPNASSNPTRDQLVQRIATLTQRLHDCQTKPTVVLESSSPIVPKATSPRGRHRDDATTHPTSARQKKRGDGTGGVACPTFRQTLPNAGAEQGVDVQLLAQLDPEPTIAVVVVAYSRPADVEKTLTRVVSILPSSSFRLFASQDSLNFPEVTDVLHRFAKQCDIVHLIHQQNTSGGTETEYANGWEAYLAISHHYQFMLQQIFSVSSYNRVIFVEDDLILADDFFSYMLASSPLLDMDPTVYCISGFNDNGKGKYVGNSSQLYRSDFFPGLGWMMSRLLWEELGPQWPAGFWDDWLRQPKHRRGRSCIRPEVSRSKPNCKNGGEEGVSQGLFCEHIDSIVLFGSKEWHAAHPADGGETSLWRDSGSITSFLEQKSYDKWLNDRIQNAVLVHSPYELRFDPDRIDRRQKHQRELSPPDLKLAYGSLEEFTSIAQQLDIMDDAKDGVPRTAYRGIVTLRVGGNQRVHLFSTTPMYE